MKYGFTSMVSLYHFKVCRSWFESSKQIFWNAKIASFAYIPLLHIKLVPGTNEKHFLDAHVNWVNLFHLENSKKTPEAAAGIFDL